MNVITLNWGISFEAVSVIKGMIMSLYNAVVVLAIFLFAGCYIFLGRKLECPECSKTSRTLSFRQVGVVMLISVVSLEAVKLYQGNYKSIITDALFWAMIWYLLSSGSKLFCWHCLKGVPINDCDRSREDKA